MTERELLSSIGITLEGEYNDNSYIVDINNSTEFGKVFTKLDDSDKVTQMEDNQVVTEQGTSLIYKSTETNYIISLIADFEGDVYSLVVNEG